MRPKNVEDIYPLSPMQQLMLLHALSSQDADTLRNQFCFEVEGALDVEAFRRAWQFVVDRHPALRNAFVWDGLPEPLQATRTNVELPFEVVDLREAGESERAARLVELREQDRAKPFKLTKAPLMRVTVALLGAERSHLIWSAHHLILDRWCFDPVFRDLFEAYGCYRAGAELRLGPPGLFRDYIAWISNESRREAESYWRSYLSGFRTPSLLAAPLSAAGGRSLGVEEVMLSAAELERLKCAAKAAGVSLASMLQGATALTVAVRTAQTDVVFGLSVSGRPPALPRIETAVGCFIGNVPVRARLDTEQTARDWLRELQAGQAARARFEAASPAEIAAWSELPEGAPLFDVLLLSAGGADGAREGHGIRLRPAEGTIESAYPLLLAAGAAEDGLRLRAVHDRACIDKMQAEAIVRELLENLRALAAGLQEPLRSFLPEGLPAASAEAAAHVPELARLRPVSGSPPALPRNELEHQLSAIWRLVLGAKTRDIHADFCDLGGNSLSALRLIGRIEELTGRRLAVTALLQHRTVANLAEALSRSGSGHKASLLARLRTGDPVRFAPLFFFEVDLAVRISRGLDPRRPAYGMIARHMIERPIGQAGLEAIAAEYVDEIMSVWPRGPFLLGGYCYGGTLAFEMARQLEAKGRRPDLLVALETSFSIPLRTYIPYLIRDRAPRRLKDLAAKPSPAGLRSAYKAAQEEIEVRLARWRREGRERDRPADLSYGGGLEQREKEIAAAVSAYRPGSFGGDVLAVFAAETPATPGHPRVASWRNFATGSVDARNVSAPHARILEDETLHEVARQLEAYLSALEAD